MSLLVCSQCGGSKIETLAWVDANTYTYKSEGANENKDRWCQDCGDHVDFVSSEEFKSSKEREEDKWSPAP